MAWTELGLVALVLVLVLGPKELPQAMRTMAKVVRRVRGLASEFQGHFNEMIREAELEDVRKSVQKLSSTNVKSQVSKMIDPTGEIDSALNKDPLKDLEKKDTKPAADTAAAQQALEPTTAPAENAGSDADADPEAPRGQAT